MIAPQIKGLIEKWGSVSLGEIVEIIGGKSAPQKSEAFSESGIPLVRMKDLGRFHLTTNLNSTVDTLSREYVNNSNLNVTKAGAILIPRTGSVEWNHRAILGVDAVVVNHICILELKNQDFDVKFLYYILCQIDMRSIMNKTTNLSQITFDRLSQFQIPKVPLKDQKRIADILDKANDIEETTEKSNEIRAELKDSIFFDLFGDLSINPDDFPEYDLSEIADFQEGPGILAVDFHDDGIPLLRLKGIENEFATLDGCNYLCPEKVEQKWKHFCVEEGDILIGSSASVGRVAIVDEDTIGAIPYTGIIRFRINEKLVNRAFVLALLRSDVFNRQVTRMSTGSTIKHFGPTHLKKVRLPVPPLNLQNELEKLFSSLNGIETTDVLAKVNSQSLSQNLLS